MLPDVRQKCQVVVVSDCISPFTWKRRAKLYSRSESKTPTRGTAVEDNVESIPAPILVDSSTSLIDTKTAAGASAPDGLKHSLIWAKTSSNRPKTQ
ncbi:hypothetical protein KM043_000087 [Ampulex compressa]|nr:hypothetical protein KM043_000087 [Ampulex compressa]